MYPNGYNMPFYSSYNIPRMGMGLGPASKMGTARTVGLFSRLGGLTNGFRNVNWHGLLNNASRTLGVINQAIPIVKQVGPMYNNMKSMIKIASLFKDETDPVPSNNSSINDNNSSVNNENTDTRNKPANKVTITADNKEKENTIIKSNYSNSPSFFI